jgi:putative glutamine amidotransferase
LAPLAAQTMTDTGNSPPLVAVPANTREHEAYHWHGAADTYLQAIVHGVGGIPLIVPRLGDAVDFDALVTRIDGVLLTGGRTNVRPESYGAAPDPRAEPHDPDRDALAFALARAALRHGVPLFAICRGVQELNVALGGSLHSEVQEIEGRHDHRAPKSESRDERFAIRQDLKIVPGGMLADILGAGTIRINSLHRQAIDRLGEGLVVEATAPDGTIEAVSVAGAPTFALGVQWHPEYWVRTDPPSARLFAAFAAAIRKRMAARESVPETAQAAE